MREPWHADPIASSQALDPLAGTVNDPDDLMSRNDRQNPVGKIAVHHKQVGAAAGTGFNPDSDFARSGQRIGSLFQDEQAVQDHGLHRCDPRFIVALQPLMPEAVRLDVRQ